MAPCRMPVDSTGTAKVFFAPNHLTVRVSMHCVVRTCSTLVKKEAHMCMVFVLVEGARWGKLERERDDCSKAQQSLGLPV